eukprot:1226167-Rhodomonas_salina.1
MAIGILRSKAVVGWYKRAVLQWSAGTDAASGIGNLRSNFGAVVIFHSDMSYTVEEHMAPPLENLIAEYWGQVPPPYPVVLASTVLPLFVLTLVLFRTTGLCRLVLMRDYAAVLSRV